MITTTEESIVDFWKERGFEPALRYTADGISCWDIDTPVDHQDLKHPEYVNMLIQEKLALPAIIRRRLQAPVYTIKSGKHYAMVDQEEFEHVVPVSRSRQLLQFAFTNPSTGMCPDIVALKDAKAVRSVLQRIQKSGAQGIMCLVTAEVAETIEIDEALRSLKELLH